jgi:hypothetical protein
MTVRWVVLARGRGLGPTPATPASVTERAAMPESVLGSYQGLRLSRLPGPMYNRSTAPNVAGMRNTADEQDPRCAL